MAKATRGEHATGRRGDQSPRPPVRALWMHFALEGPPLKLQPSSLAFVHPPPPHLLTHFREKLDLLVLQELLVLAAPR